MSNEIRKAEPSSIAPAPVFSAHAEGDGIAVGYADSFAPTINLFLPDGSKTAANPDYFNLIIGYDPFPSNHILIDKGRALTEYISDEVKAEFGGWTPENIEKIKNRLRLFNSPAPQSLRGGFSFLSFSFIIVL